MPRNPELDKLLREVNDLTSAPPTQYAEETTQAYSNEEPNQAKKSSSFMKSVVGLFIEQDDEPTQADTSGHSAPPPTPNTVAEIAETVAPPTFKASGDDMSGKTFADIYSEAGVDEAVFTVDKLSELLQDPTLKDQPASTKSLVVKMALKAQNVGLDVPVTDAVKRDKALDAYQKMLNERAAQTEINNSVQIQQINEEVKKFLEQKNAEMDTLRTETAEMKRQADIFASRRIQEEQRLAEIIVPLLEGQPNPVTTGNDVD